MRDTVSRNAKRRIADLRSRLTVCVVYRLENDFHGKPVDPAHAWTAFDNNPHAKLRARADGTFTVDVHGNLWYELAEGPAEDVPYFTGGSTVREDRIAAQND